jgi:hypothetical protein
MFRQLARFPARLQRISVAPIREYSLLNTLKNEIKHEELKDKPEIDWKVEEKGSSLVFTKNHKAENLTLTLSNPQEFNLVVEKQGKQVEFELALDEDLIIEGVVVGKSEKDSLGYSPVIEELDETLVDELYAFVQDRVDLDQVLNYYEYKEQKDYIQWLQGFKEFAE